MPHFGADYIPSPVRCCTTHAILNLVGQPPAPLTVGIDSHQSISLISDVALGAIFGRADYGSIELEVQLLTLAIPKHLQLVGGSPHVSDPKAIRFEIVSGWKLPKQIGVLLGNDFIQFWHRHPWGLGLVLSRRYIDCAPA